MSRIINPNAPKRSALDDILETMRVIALYRQQYLTLEAGLNIDNLTATQIEDLHIRKERVAIELIEFIMYGAKKHGNHTSNSQAPTPRIEDNAQEHAPSEARPDNTPRTVILEQGN
jgi:hypothetical protein